MYSTLIKHRNSSPPTAEKRLKERHFDTGERHKIYSLPFFATKEIKLSMFQYKAIHNILYTYSMLYKMKKVKSPYCPFCPNINQTVSHLSISCRFAATFWSQVIEWYHSSTKTLSLSKNEIYMYGVLNNWSSCSTLNHLILIGKYFLYRKALNNIQF